MFTFRRRSGSTRTVVGLAAAVALSLGLASCAGGGGSSPDAGTIPTGGTDDGSTLTLWVRASLEKQSRLLVEAYNASHENQVNLTVVPAEDYATKVGAAAGSGGLPDMFGADIVYVPNWVEQGLYRDISAQIDELPFKDEINKGHLTAGTMDGKEHVLPLVMDLSMMFWNKELFAEAGLDPEKAPATLEDFTAAAQAVQGLGKPGVYGTAVPLNCGGCLVFTGFPSVWADGDEVMNEDGTASLLAEDSAVALYDQWKTLWDDGAILPSSPDENGATWVAGFQNGKVGVQMYPATMLSSLPFDAGVAGIPGSDGGGSTFVGGDGIGISKDSEKAAQAWNFLDWLMSEDAQVGVLAKNSDVVARADLADNEYASQDPRLVTINKVAAQGKTPYSLQFFQAFNAPGSPWLSLVRNEVLGDGGTLEADNDEITAVLDQ